MALQKITEWWFNDQIPSMGAPVFFNTYKGAGVDKFPRSQWGVADCSPFVPPGTKEILLMGILIITHGGNPNDYPDLQVLVRRHGSYVDDQNALGQVTAEKTAKGPRTNWFCPCPLSDDLKFDFKWRLGVASDLNPFHEITPENPIPGGSTYGTTLHIVGAGR